MYLKNISAAFSSLYFSLDFVSPHGNFHLEILFSPSKSKLFKSANDICVVILNSTYSYHDIRIH